MPVPFATAILSLLILLAPASSRPVDLGPPPDIGQIQASAIQSYVQARTAADVGAYLETRAVGDYLASRQSTSVDGIPSGVPPSPVTVSGDCSGFPIPGWIIQRESGGDPSAVNPSSGAFGCAQELPAHFQPGGACAGLDMYAVDGQRACAVILSDGGTNLAPWSG